MFILLSLLNLLLLDGGAAADANPSTDPTKIVADSRKAGSPIVFVSMNYRVNVFGFGDGKEKNLALKDQRLGIDWVRKNIAAFGGDPVSAPQQFRTHQDPNVGSE